MYVVDLKRHNDGEDGLVGSFDSREAAQRYIDAISNDFVREYATIRPVHEMELVDLFIKEAM